MNYEEMMHGMIVEYVRLRLAREYKEIRINPAGSPDLVLANHGLVLAHVEVVTDKTITQDKAGIWKQLVEHGPKLILVVPKGAKVRVMEMLWQQGIADKVGVGSYEISLSMP